MPLQVVLEIWKGRSHMAWCYTTICLHMEKSIAAMVWKYLGEREL